jgi:DNA-binding NtrC family response regulator
MSQKPSVLIVDDEEVVRRAHQRSLEPVYCQTRAAADGQEAIQAMEEHASDVILLDIRMPGLNGMDVLKTIKTRWPDSEVVVVTGYPDIAAAKEAVRLGAHDYIAKPVAPDQLLKAANDAITQKHWALRSEQPHSV